MRRGGEQEETEGGGGGGSLLTPQVAALQMQHSAQHCLPKKKFICVYAYEKGERSVCVCTSVRASRYVPEKHNMPACVLCC